MSCSRGLPESWVMMTLSRSTVRMRSRITRYWLMGTSSESRCFPHSASHSFLAAATSSLSEASELPPPAPFCRPTSAMTASSTSAASPITAWSTRYSLLMSAASLVEWMMVLPAGTPGPNGVRVRLEPIASTRSAFGKGALARIGGDHRRRNELGQSAEPIARFGIKHALPGQQQRIFRLEQHAHRGLDRVGIGGCALDRDGGVIELALVLGLPYLGWNLDEDGPALAAAHGVIGAPHQVGQLLNGMRQRRPLGDRPIDVGGAEYRPDILPRQRQPGRNDQERDVLGKGLGNAGEGVLDAGSGLGGEYAVALAALDAGIAVRQADAHALLPAQDRTDVERGAGLDQRIAGITGEELRSLAPEDFGDDGGAVHGLSLPWTTGVVR